MKKVERGALRAALAQKVKDGALDFAQLHQGWADKLARTLYVPLATCLLLSLVLSLIVWVANR